MMNFKLLLERKKGTITWISVTLLSMIVLFMPRIVMATDYYPKATGSLHLNATWGTNTDGSGSTPTFTAAGNTYYIWNSIGTTSFSNTTAWTVSGTGSKVVVGNGSDAITFTVDVTGTNSLLNLEVTANAIVAVNSGFTLTVPENLTVDGIIQNGTGAATLTLSGSAKTIDGSGVISIATFKMDANTDQDKTIPSTANLNITSPSVVISSSSTNITNNGIVSITGILSGNGTWTNAANSTLNYSNSSAFANTLTATAAGNTVNYNGIGAQTIKNQTYYNLTISGSRTTNSVTIPNGGTINITGNLTASATFTTGSITNGGLNTITFNGTSPQTITNTYTVNSVSTAIPLSSLTINNSLGVTLTGGDLSVGASSGVLTLTNGVLKIGANTFKYIHTATPPSGSTTSYIATMGSTTGYGGFLWAPTATISSLTNVSLPVGSLGTAGTPAVTSYRPVLVSASGGLTSSSSFSIGFIGTGTGPTNDKNIPTSGNNRVGDVVTLRVTGISGLSKLGLTSPGIDYNTANPSIGSAAIFYFNGSVWTRAAWSAAPANVSSGSQYYTITGLSSFGTTRNFILGVTGGIDLSGTAGSFSYTWNGSASTAWNNTSNWTSSPVGGTWPGNPANTESAGDNATIINTSNQPSIPNGGNYTINNLAVNGGTLTLAFTNTLNILGSMTMGGGTLVMGSNTVNLYGDLINTSGTLTLSSGSNFNFVGTTNSKVTGQNPAFYLWKMNKGSGTATTTDTMYVVDFQTNYTQTFSPTLTSGTIKYSNTMTVAASNPAVNNGIWMNGATWTAGSGGTLNGLLRISSGTISYTSAEIVSSTGFLDVQAGTLNLSAALTDNGKMAISGVGVVNVGYDGSTFNTLADFTLGASPAQLSINATDNTKLSLSCSRSLIHNNAAGGTLNITAGLVTLDRGTSPAAVALQIGANGVVNMSGGKIILQNITSSTSGDVTILNSTNNNFTGGTIQFGNASTASGVTFKGINSTQTTNPPDLALVAGAGTISVPILTSSLTVRNLTIGSSTTLNSNSLDLTLKGNWTNGGTFTQGTRTVTLSGTTAQTVGGTAATTFNNLIINNAAGVTLDDGTNAQTKTVGGILTLTDGILTSTTSPRANLLSVTNTATTAFSGASASSFISGPVKWSLGAAGTYIAPVGKGTGNYFPFKLVTSAASSPVITFEAFNTDAGSGATFSSPLTFISHAEYWNATLNSGTFTGAVSLTRVAALGSLNLIGQSSAQGGTYASIGGTPATPSINTSNNISTGGFFVMASNAPPPTLTIGSNAQAGAAYCAGNTQKVIHSFTVTGSNGGGTINSVSFTPSSTSTYTASEIAKFQLWTTGTTSTFTSPVQVGGDITTILGPNNLMTFPTVSQLLGNVTNYFWITMNVAGSVINGHTIIVNATGTSNLTSSDATVSGSGSGSGTFSLGAPAATGVITGTAVVCLPVNGVPYSVAPISGAASYIWAYSGTGATINGTSNNITIDFSGFATGGNLTVRGTNACGNGTISVNYPVSIQTYDITVNQASNGSITPPGTGNLVTVNCGADQQFIITANSGYHIVDVITDAGSQGAVGTYSFTNVQANGHTITAQFAINCTAPILTADITNVRCNSGSNGAIDLHQTGGDLTTIIWTKAGDPGYVFAPSSTSEDISGLTAGTYVVTASTTVGTCQISGTYTVTEPGALSVAISGSQTVCSNNTNANLSVVFTGGTAPWTFVYDDGSGPSSPVSTSSGTYSLAVSPSTTTTYTLVSVTDVNSCSGITSGSATVTVNPNPTATITSADGGICNGLSYNITGNVTAIGAWTLTLNNGVGIAIGNGSGTYSVSGTPSTTTTYTIASLQDAYCAAQAGDLTGSTEVAVTPSPTANLSGGATYCAGQSTTTTLTLTLTGSGTITGHLSPGNIPFTATSTTSYVDVSPSVTTTYSVSDAADDNCSAVAAGLTGSATVTINPLPSGTLSASASTVCEGATVGLTFNATTGTGPFTIVVNTTTYTNISSGVSFATVTPSVPSSDYELTDITDFGISPNCSNSVSSTATVTVVPAPSANSGDNASTTICSTGSYAVTNASVSNNASFVWSSNGDGSFSPSATALNPTYTPGSTDISQANANGTYSVTITLTAVGNGPCASATSSKTLTINGAVTANSGNNSSTTICSTGNYAVANASATNASSFVWNSTGDGSFSPSTTALNPTYNPGTNDVASANLAGSFSVTITLNVAANSPCSNTNDSKTLTINGAATASSGNNASTTICSTGNYVVANASVSNNASFMWSSNGDGSFSPSATSLNPTYNPGSTDISQANANGTKTVTITLTADGNSPCANAISSKTLTINGAATAHAGNNNSTTICSTGSYAVANASVTNSSSFNWSSSGDGTFSPSATALNPTYTPGSTDVSIANSTGTKIVIITLNVIANSPCSNTSDFKTITIKGIPTTASVGGNQTVCSTSTTVTSNTPTVGTGLWSSTGGTFGNASNANTTFSGTAGGTYTITWTISNSPCASSSSNAVIYFEATPTANAGSNQDACINNASAQLNGSVGGSATGGFWTSSGTGSFNNSNILNPIYNPSTTDKNVGTVTLTLHSTGSTVCSPATSNMVLTIHTLPTAAASSNSPLCQGATLTLNATTNTGVTFLWASPNGGLSSTTAQSPNITNVPVAAGGLYTVTVTDGFGCSKSGTTSVTVNPLAAPPDISASGPTTFCHGGSVTLTADGGVSYLWSTGETTASITVQYSASISASITADANGCVSNGPASVIITVHSLPDAVINSTPVANQHVYCYQAGQDLSVSVTDPGCVPCTPFTYQWYESSTPNTVLGTNSTYHVTSQGNYNVRVTNSVGCASLRCQ